MPTTTTNYSFQKPTIGGDDDAWGGYLNNNWDSVDSLLSGGTQVDGIDMVNAIVGAASIAVDGAVTETVEALSGNSPTITVANGTIKTWTLTGTGTPTFSLSAGQSFILSLSTAGNSVTWPTMEWVGGAAPVLDASDENWITIWRVGSTYYGQYAGASS